MDKKAKIELNAQPRTITGRRVHVLRHEGLIPAVLYGKGQEALSLQVPEKDFAQALKSAGESTLVYVNVDLPAQAGGRQQYPAIIHDVARDPISDSVIHADFYKVRLDEKVKAGVPVTFVGESPAVAELKGIFVRNANELEVEALPQDLPHEISIDISSLARFNDQILAKDIKLPAGVKLMAGGDEVIATIQEPISEEELKAQLEAPTADVSAVEEVEKPAKPEEEAVEGETPPPAAPAAPQAGEKGEKQEEKK